MNRYLEKRLKNKKQIKYLKLMKNIVTSSLGPQKVNP